jgi:tRNA_anti-like
MSMNRMVAAWLLLPLFACSSKTDSPVESNPHTAISNSSNTSNNAEAKTASLADAKPDFTYTAQQWFDEFKADEAAAKAKYRDKIIEISGEVQAVLETEVGKDKMLSLVHFKVEKDLLGVRCDILGGSIWKSVMPKSKTTIRGYYSNESIFKAELYPAIVVKTDSRFDRIKAVDLAGAAKSDLKATSEKYNDRWIWIEGTVKRAGKTKDGYVQIVLDGVGTLDVECGVPADSEKRVLALKPGQPIAVFGELAVFTFAESGNLSVSQSRFELLPGK